MWSRVFVKGRRIRVPVRVWAQTQQFSFGSPRGVVDTASDITVFNKRFVDQLDYILDNSKKDSLSGFGGEQPAHRIIVSKIRALGGEVTNIMVKVADFPLHLSKIDVVLGQNFLEQFDLFIYGPKGIVEAKKS